ncbi:ABC transporter permease [Brevundimonas sp. 2R-24]|uniref:ABC transporter permease n=1 Tax=Peiella sedimenti TaxID=3061083 RepID=A0ABT8SH77_9CAUL|nr:ABC transporter permease [Caulobacteraceae bacterium XZ-24]
MRIPRLSLDLPWMRGSGRRPGPLLPLEDARSAALIFVMAALAFLACMAAMGASAGGRAAEGWARDLRGEATVQVRPRADETPAAAAARAAETLGGVPGVEEAAVLERERAEALLRPWLGEAILEDLPIPQLVTVRLTEAAPADARALNRALAEAGLDAVVDDHGRWLADVERAARVAGLIALMVFLLTAAAAGAAVVFATRAGLEARRDVIEILSLSGATDRTVAGVFQRRFALAAGLAGLYGAVAAAGVAALMRLAGGSDGFTPALPLAWSDLLLVSPCPLVAASLGAVAARWTTLRLLKGMA